MMRYAAHVTFLTQLLVIPSVVALSQPKSEFLEFEYANKRKYHLDGDFYPKRFFLSALTWKKPECMLSSQVQTLAETSLNGVYLKDDSVFIKSDHRNKLNDHLKRLNEYIVIDVIQDAQYQCGEPNRFNKSLSSRGRLMRPVFRNKMRKDSGDLFIGTLPVVPVGSIQFRVYLIKKTRCDGACCCTIGWHIEKKRIDDIFNKVALNIEPLIRTPPGFYTKIRDQEAKITRKYRITYVPNQTSFNALETPQLDSLIELGFAIDSVNVFSFSSIEGLKDSNEKLHKERASNVLKFFKNKQHTTFGFKSVSRLADIEFMELIENSRFDSLSKYSIEEIARLISIDRQLKKDLTPILAKTRFSEVKIVLKQDLKKVSAEEFYSLGYIKALETNNHRNALIFQNLLMQANPFSEALLSHEVPVNSNFVDVLNNFCISVYLNILNGENLQINVIRRFEELLELSPNHAVIRWNLAAVKLNELIMAKTEDNYDIRSNLKSILALIKEAEDSEDIPQNVRGNLLAKASILANDLTSEENTRSTVKALAKAVNRPMDVLLLAQKFLSMNRPYEAAELMNRFVKNKMPKKKGATAPWWRERIYAVCIYANYLAGGYDKSSDLVRMLKTFSKIDQDIFCATMKSGILGISLLEEPGVKRAYCNSCMD